MALFNNSQRDAQEASKWWWLFLVTGTAWLIISLIVFRFDLTSVEAIGIMIGVVVIVAGLNEFMTIGVTQGGWKWVHAILGGIFIVGGVAALFYPGRTFVTLAAIIGWVLLFKGIFDVITALMDRQRELWWLRLVAGGAEILLAFWAAGYFGRKAILLIAFVGAWALIRGVTEIITAFQVRAVHKQAEQGIQTAPMPAASPSVEVGPTSAPA